MEPGFFHVTLNGLGIIGAILGVGWQVIKRLRRLDRGFDIWQWQHNTMWEHHKSNYRFQPYPEVGGSTPLASRIYARKPDGPGMSGKMKGEE